MRRGTIEELARRPMDEGAEGGIILGKGGRVFTWVWRATREVRRKGGEDDLRERPCDLQFAGLPPTLD